MDRPYSQFSSKLKRRSTEELGSFKIIHTDCAVGDSDTNAFNIKTTSEYKIVHNETRQTNRHKNPSGVWRYFALATKDISSTHNPDEQPDDRILCMLCYGKGRVHVYKSKTSSSNLWKHLNRKHNIEIPSEKMFAIPSAGFEGFDFGTDDQSQEANSTDDQLSAVDVEDNDEIVIKTDDYEETDGFQEEHIIATSLEDDSEKHHHPETIVKYEPCSSYKEDSCGEIQRFPLEDIGSAIIQEVAKRPLLYEAPASKSVSVRATKEMLWTEVYHALGEIIQVDRIQKIWKNIRDRYRKIRSAEIEGSDVSSQKYKYYDQLRFLDPIITIEHSSDVSLDEPPDKKPRNDDYPSLFEMSDIMLSTVDDMDRSEQSFISEEIVQDNNCTVSSSNPPNTTTLYPIEMTQSNHDNVTMKSISLSPCRSFEQLDEFDLFGKLIAKKLRSVPRERVDLIEIKIMQTIHENS